MIDNEQNILTPLHLYKCNSMHASVNFIVIISDVRYHWVPFRSDTE